MTTDSARGEPTSLSLPLEALLKKKKKKKKVAQKIHVFFFWYYYRPT